MKTTNYTTKEILNNFIDNDFKEVKNKIEKITEKMTEFATKQLIINEQLLNFKKQTENDKAEKKEKRRTSMTQKITIAIAIGNGLLAVFLAFN
jgi:hypothetical protein